jgi:predicted glutamine amidotransferase
MGKEIFFVHNGKLVQTYLVTQEDNSIHNQIMEKLTEQTDYLFFSISKYVRHKFNAPELDEIKVISNWLALNRDRNSVMEISDGHAKEDVIRFIAN